MLAIAAAWVAAPANGGILGFTGDAALISPPTSVESEQLLPNAMAGSFLFLERERYTLPVAVDVDWDASIALNGTIAEGTGFFSGVIPAGTEVDSIYFHFDTPLQTLGGVVVGVVTDAPILGVIVTPELLDASDPELGAPGTAYPTGLDFRGTAGQVNESDDHAAGRSARPRCAPTPLLQLSRSLLIAAGACIDLLASHAENRGLLGNWGTHREAAADHQWAMASTAVALVTLPIVLYE